MAATPPHPIVRIGSRFPMIQSGCDLENACSNQNSIKFTIIDLGRLTGSGGCAGNERNLVNRSYESNVLIGDQEINEDHCGTDLLNRQAARMVTALGATMTGSTGPSRWPRCPVPGHLVRVMTGDSGFCPRGVHGRDRLDPVDGVEKTLPAISRRLVVQKRVWTLAAGDTGHHPQGAAAPPAASWSPPTTRSVAVDGGPSADRAGQGVS
ncbi:hypothetical protein [Frankia sp. BMG5.23]|uniref:hypothetical protein n=1 Tax=Frankia sp. BMG5.23 TaxID=683305 RepID=UPI000461334B|nr:hypothetical protein [Frankia sp. BMG5.23]KDA40748.1 hypothetical protein BMG523Draft_04438 [Frankia sp. BMG5.23]